MTHHPSILIIVPPIKLTNRSEPNLRIGSLGPGDLVFSVLSQNTTFLPGHKHYFYCSCPHGFSSCNRLPTFALSTWLLLMEMLDPTPKTEGNSDGRFPMPFFISQSSSQKRILHNSFRTALYSLIIYAKRYNSNWKIIVIVENILCHWNASKILSSYLPRNPIRAPHPWCRYHGLGLEGCRSTEGRILTVPEGQMRYQLSPAAYCPEECKPLSAWSAWSVGMVLGIC